ncbi:transcription elongation factor, mitochondrial [Brachyhypopomus gauderio]|uniref:transcription elongation factor, mitochondrial n=1 Tax=Brachyhypopomus gauderio TaxID=698409 RepID=UPI004041ECA4
MWAVNRLLSFVVRKGHYGLFSRPPRPLTQFEVRFLHCTCCWGARIPAVGFDPLNVDSSPLCQDETKLDSLYTREQRAVILQLLNTASESELAAVKLLRGRKSVNIIDYRSRNGPFKDLESVLNVPLLKHKSAVIVFNAIINPGVKTKRKGKTQLAKFIRPEVYKTQLEEASSIVSIVCGTQKIAWTHLDRAMRVLDWQQEECSSFMKETYMASSYLNDVSAVVSHLPAADFYVVEKPGVSVQNTALFPVMAHLRTVEAMLFALLGQRREAGAPPNVLNMMRVAVGRHFDLIVGERRTSGARVVRQLMTEAVTKQVPRVSVPRELLLRYRDAFRLNSWSKGEELGDALLQAVAFYELLAE